MTSPLSSIPRAITAGDAAAWRLSLPAYPASDGWAVSYALVKGDRLISIAAAADGDQHLVSLSSAVTEAYSPGTYTYQQYATKDGNRHTLATGRITIEADFARAVEGYDGRSPAERTLELLQQTYDKVAAKALASKSSGSISVADKQLTELREQIDKQKGVVAGERRRKALREGRRPGTRIKVRFR
jgi:hypothetical protein